MQPNSLSLEFFGLINSLVALLRPSSSDLLVFVFIGICGDIWHFSGCSKLVGVVTGKTPSRSKSSHHNAQTIRLNTKDNSIGWERRKAMSGEPAAASRHAAYR
jgi:hypothetical protein